jgi:mannose-6-phosphate isomerase-like protein (cupin superfamily)
MEVRDPSSTSSSSVHVAPAEGRAMRMAGAQLVALKVSSEQTGGAYSLFEVAVAPQGGSQPHVQHREDECFYVLEGEFEFLVEGARIEAGPGSLVYVPKGNLHAFENAGKTTGRLLVSHTPGGAYEGFVEEVGRLMDGEAGLPAFKDRPNAESLVEIATTYGIEILPPFAGKTFWGLR